MVTSNSRQTELNLAVCSRRTCFDKPTNLLLLSILLFSLKYQINVLLQISLLFSHLILIPKVSSIHSMSRNCKWGTFLIIRFSCILLWCSNLGTKLTCYLLPTSKTPSRGVRKEDPSKISPLEERGMDDRKQSLICRKDEILLGRHYKVPILGNREMF